MDYRYPLFWPYMDENIKKQVMKTLGTRWLGQGPQVDDFEKDVEKKFDVPYAVAVSSGSAALETAFDLLDIQAGDEVLVPVLTCTATNIPPMRKGAKLIFLDVDKQTLCPDWEDVKRKVTHKTKAIVTVHLGGVESSMPMVYEDVPVIDDSAQAFGIFNGYYTAVSFQAIKFFTTGDGGMFFCQGDDDYRKAKLMRWFGIDREKKRSDNWQNYKKREMTFDIETVGYKRQMTDISASMGINGLKAYDKIMDYRTKLFNIYKNRLAGISGITVVDAHEGDRNLHWLLTVIVDRRDDFAKMLLDHGVETNLVQIRNDIFGVFGGKRLDLPNMNNLESKYLCLPLNTHITSEDVEKICDYIQEGW